MIWTQGSYLLTLRPFNETINRNSGRERSHSSPKLDWLSWLSWLRNLKNCYSQSELFSSVKIYFVLFMLVESLHIVVLIMSLITLRLPRKFHLSIKINLKFWGNFQGQQFFNHANAQSLWQKQALIFTRILT